MNNSTKKLMKKLLLITICLFTMSCNLSNHTFALTEPTITVGSRLPQPEQGWKRFEEVDPNIKFSEHWGRLQNANFSGGTALQASPSYNNSLKFNFTGTKIRLIFRAYLYGTNPTIQIDNNPSEIIKAKDYSGFQIVVYENENLSNKEHYVTITSNAVQHIFDAMDIDANGQLMPYNNNPVATSESIAIETQNSEVNIGDEFTTDIILNGGKNTCAEDIKIAYDKNLFEYIDNEQIKGLKVYKTVTNVDSGTLRFIIASLGKENSINEAKPLIKLKFRAKKNGKGTIDILKVRIADNGTIEKDVLDANCGQKEITVTGYSDINRTGTFTLLDLGIDAWYYNEPVSSTDTSKYDTDIVANEIIDDTDLSLITDQVLKSKNYEPNTY